jgi:hypothetical protein
MMLVQQVFTSERVTWRTSESKRGNSGQALEGGGMQERLQKERKHEGTGQGYCPIGRSARSSIGTNAKPRRHRPETIRLPCGVIRILLQHFDSA